MKVNIRISRLESAIDHSDHSRIVVIKKAENKKRSAKSEFVSYYNYIDMKPVMGNTQYRNNSPFLIFILRIGEG